MQMKICFKIQNINLEIDYLVTLRNVAQLSNIA